MQSEINAFVRGLSMLSQREINNYFKPGNPRKLFFKHPSEICVQMGDLSKKKCALSRS